MTITALPPAPSRANSPSDFSTKADALLGALPQFVTEANALQADVNAKQSAAAASATTATEQAALATTNGATQVNLAAEQAALATSNGAAQVALAAERAQAAAESAAAAAGVANFKGQWVNLTGALAAPATVYHANRFWVLLNSLANVATSEPGVSADWAMASGGGGSSAKSFFMGSM